MKQKGFTLIELLGVIILIALISLIIIPGISSVLKNGKIKADEKLNDNIILATKNWAVDNKDKLPSDGNYTLVDLKELQDAGYIDNNIVKPSTGEEIDKVCVRIKNQNKVYHYDFDGECNSKIESILTTKYRCQDGYTLNDSKKCVKTWTETTIRNEDKDYYCTQPDYQVSGSQCRKTTRTTTDRKYSAGYYYCPSGYTKNGTTCTKNESINVTGWAKCENGTFPGLNSDIQGQYGQYGYKCVGNYNGYLGTNCETCPATGTATVNCYAKCSRTLTQTASYSSGYYYCPSGYTSSGSGSTMTCYKDVVTTMDAAYTFVYSCPSGYTSSGSGSTMTCSKEVTDTKNPTSRQVYDCPKDYTLIGDENSKESYCIK